MRLQRHPQGTAMTGTIFDKTTAGRDEVRTRVRGLPQRLRSVLILVDGARTEAALRQAVELTAAPVDTVETHRVVTRAVDEGDIPRARIEEAAARIVALQLWQQRAAAQAPLPADLSAVAQDAAAALMAAAY